MYLKSIPSYKEADKVKKVPINKCKLHFTDISDLKEIFVSEDIEMS